MFLPLCLFALTGCAHESAPFGSSQSNSDSRRVLVVYNSASPQSEEIAKYYVLKRKIPGSNVVKLDCTKEEDVPTADYLSQIQAPVQANLKSNKNQIDFIVLMKGVPIRLKEGMQYSVDATLAAMELKFLPIQKLDDDNLKRCLNPYFTKTDPFTHERYGFYLVTRIDGYTTDDCKNLIDHSLAAKPDKGLFFFDQAANRNGQGSKEMNDALSRANEVLGLKGYESRVDRYQPFVAPTEKLMGYVSWGSNDDAFNLSTYKQLKFKPGALAETFVSTSARTFHPTVGGQSLIADLIARGVTGIKGYVSEPYTFALAKPQLLFDRYTGGRNLAESFYSASMFLKWKDVVIGDPLCAPYAKPAKAEADLK